jgi:hypothetical protein
MKISLVNSVVCRYCARWTKKLIVPILCVIGATAISVSRAQQSYIYDYDTLGAYGRETVVHYNALFDDTETPCLETTGMFYATQSGMRFVRPVVQSKHGTKVSQNAQENSVSILFESEECRYEITVKRWKKKNGSWGVDVLRNVKN